MVGSISNDLKSFKGSRASGGISLSVLAGISSIVAGIVLLPFILNETGAKSYGVWLILSAVASYLYYSDIGVGAAISHFGSRTRGGQSGPRLQALLACGLVWSGLACILVVPLYAFFSKWYVDRWGASVSESDQPLLVLISVGLLVPLLLRPFGSALIGAGFLTVERRNQLAGVSVRVIGTIAVCTMNGGILGVALVELCALLLPSILATASLGRRGILHLNRSDISVDTLRLMLSFSYKSFSVSLIGALTLQSGMIIIGLVGSSAEVTFYNAAFRIYSSIRQLLSWTVDPFRPALSRIFARNRHEADTVLMSLLLISLSAGAIGCTSLVIAVPDLVGIWLGDSVPTNTVAIAAQILLIGLLINMIHIPLAPATDAAGRPGVLLWGQLVWLVTSVALSIPLTIHLGIVGTALGLSIPLLIVEPLMIWLAMNALSIRFRDWFTSVAVPVITIVLCSLVLTTIVHLFCIRVGVSFIWFISGACFGVFAVIISVVGERRFRLRSSLSLLNVGL